MKKVSLYNLFYIFIIGSVCGWVIEFFWTLIKKGLIINHSAVVIGPFNMAYGLCAVVFTFFLYKFKDAPIWKIFIIGFVAGTILEYIMSWGMELILGFSAWDYSEKFLNINGRVALLYSVCWGLLSILWIKYLYPWIIKLIEKINPKVGKIIIICLSVFLLFDVLLTFSAIDRAHDADKGIPPHNSYEKFLDKTFNSKYLKNMFNNQWK